ncbi:hypothetical protein PALB_30290 [Pseudoalteromonas luteoviolacea B = ATCC 29581]|nr:hypothetical protein PALB_30290 [Pseudoalteromonas luteoviolacea B = ATCC 29581]
MPTIYTLLVLLLSTFLIGCGELSSIIHESSEKSESSNFLKSCLKQKICAERLNAEQIVLSRDVVVPEEAFQVFIKTTDNQVPKGQLKGVSMNMGTIPLIWQRIEGNIFMAQAMVGVCYTEDMIWEIQVFTNNVEVASMQFRVMKEW